MGRLTTSSLTAAYNLPLKGDVPMKRLELLDYGRLAAAVAVMGFHYLFNGINNGKVHSISASPEITAFVKYGYLGVEFFFLISGYVIFFSAQSRSAAEFFVSRATRLVPAFIPALIITATAAQFWGGDRMSVTLLQAVANTTFFPGVFGYSFVDGVYWTLAVEITFYGGVFALLLVGARKHLRMAFILWPFAMVFAAVVGLSGLRLAGGYYTFFAAGALFALVKSRRDTAATTALVTAMGLCVWFAAGGASAMEAAKGVSYSGGVIAAVVIAMFVFFLALNTSRASSLRLPGSRLAGTLTYPVYLLHAHLGYMLLNRFATEENKWVAYPSIAVFIFVLAYGLHVVFERRLGPYWKRGFERLVAIRLPAPQRTRDEAGAP